jgi:hypothetical protein
VAVSADNYGGRSGLGADGACVGLACRTGLVVWGNLIAGSERDHDSGPSWRRSVKLWSVESKQLFIVSSMAVRRRRAA